MGRKLVTKEQPGTWGKNKSTKDDGLGVGMRESPGCTLHPNASFASIPACITGMRAEVKPPAAAPTKHPVSTLQGLEGSAGTLEQKLEGDEHPIPFSSDPLTPSEAYSRRGHGVRAAPRVRCLRQEQNLSVRENPSRRCLGLWE